MMIEIRRSKYVFFHLNDGHILDIHALLHGSVILNPGRQVLAISILRGEEYPIAIADLWLLFQIPSNTWVPLENILHESNVDVHRVTDLIHKGLLLSTDSDQTLVELRAKDEGLDSNQWHIYAALYHCMTKWQDVRVQINVEGGIQELDQAKFPRPEVLEAFIEQYGEPPSHFHSHRHILRSSQLPLTRREGGLYETLAKRKTTRAFDTHKAMSIEQLAIILYYAYGYHGYSKVYRDIVGLRRTSPSGGGLHPTEVYPLIINVDDLDAGLYHYNARDHALDLMTALDQAKARDWADEFTAGQFFPRSAHVLFVMTTRFYRNYWKYRKHNRTYPVLYMDVAHLSQTVYLLCADLGLGAFVSAAINGVNIERALGLDGVTEGAMAVCGCGVPLKKARIDPQFHEYVPRETNLGSVLKG